MKRLAGRMGLLVTGLLLLLTYLLLRAATPDGAVHQRRMTMLDMVILQQAALQRDLLRARSGSLRQYDPLVSAIAGLREATAGLNDLHGPDPQGRSDLGPRVDALAAEIAAQEALVEEFKSTNALLQNSLTYVAHLTHRLGTIARETSPNLSVAVGGIAESLFQFTRDPTAASASAAAGAALDRLSGATAPVRARDDARALVTHGRLILMVLPVVDRNLARLSASRATLEARSIRARLLEVHRDAQTRARGYRMLLYAASLLLLAHLTYLYVRLQASVQALADRSQALIARSDFEHVIASMSTHFIDLPSARLAAGVRAALRRLGPRLASDRAYVVIPSMQTDGTTTARSYAWRRPGVRTRSEPLTAAWASGALTLGTGWALPAWRRQGCIGVSPVSALPSGAERTTLESHRVRSWLCVPFSHAGDRVGILGFDRVEDDAPWPEDALPLLRTVGEIFGNAFAREQAERERERLETRLRQAHRMEAIGTVAGGVAHNFNNVLGAILGYTEMALAALGPTSAVRRHLQEVWRAGERGKGVVDQILTFARPSEHASRPVHLQREVDDTLRLLRASLPTTITICSHLAGNHRLVWGHAAELQQVVMNLCTNAAHAMRGHGVVEVTLEPIDLPHARQLSHGTLDPGPYLRLAVSDTGEGMDAPTLRRIFEPFFTTRAASAGTGLGLSTVQHIVVGNHGGALDVRSRRGVGSVFEVWLPQTTRASDETAETRPAPILRGRGETILFVDNDPSLVLLAEEMLAALGYECIGFEASADALSAFRAAPDRFDVLLADVALAETNGVDWAAAAHRIRRDIPILLMTGRGDEGDAHSLRAAGVRDVLTKPLASADIAAALARHLRLSGGPPDRKPAD